MKFLHDDISKLLASYGGQLDYCTVENMNECELARITSACKNARFSVTVCSSSGSYVVLKVVRGQLDKLRVLQDGGLCDFGELKSACNECVNIRDVEIKKRIGVELSSDR